MASQIPVIEGTGQPSYALRHLITEELLKVQNPLNNLSDAFFIPNPQSSETPILGPAFDELPLAFMVHCPIFEEYKILHYNNDLDWVHWVKKNFVCWPVFDSNWCQWTERMFTMKKDYLVKVGLKNLIRLL